MTLWFGGDYNPEQWPEEVWADDIQLMQRAGVTVATVGVFSWARLELADGRFDFGWLDRILDALHAAGIKVDLATATASPPPWLTLEHPDILPVTESGERLWNGSRQQYSPHSASYRHYAARLVRELVTRYASHPALVAWHINNEYGCHVARSYDDEGAAGFRVWLESKYGSVAALNAAWGTSFWSQHYGSFDEVFPPRAAPTFRNPTQLLDWDRFSSDAMLELFQAEAAIIREISPGIPITTNFMGAFKPLDYWRWAQEVDFVSDDSYPDPADPDSHWWAAMSRDLMRSLRQGQSWILMEQAPSAVNWRNQNAPKGPGGNRVLSLQSLARGADGIMYFQWRQSVAGAEKFHSGMVPHAGAESRVYREVEALGNELPSYAGLEGATVDARVAIVFDWDAWWAIEQEASPTTIDYLATVQQWYRSLYERTVTVDFVRASDDLSKYAVVIAPTFFAAPAEHLAKLAEYAENGGRLVVSYQSGILDEQLHVSKGGYLGALQATLGVRIEEFAPLAHPSQFGQETLGVPAVTTRVSGSLEGEVSLWTEYLHTDDAEVVSTFTEGDVTGWPAITRRGTGGSDAAGSDAGSAAAGSAWYVATQPGRELLGELLGRVLDEAGVSGILDQSADGVEAVRRGDTTFVINHRPEPRDVVLGGVATTIPPRDVLVIRG